MYIVLDSLVRYFVDYFIECHCLFRFSLDEKETKNHGLGALI